MFRVTRPLNHNALLAFDMEDGREYLVVGRGVGFGRKPGERVGREGLAGAGDLQLYLLTQQVGGRGTPRELIERIDPTVLDIAEDIYMDARLSLGHIDPNMLLPLADHLAFAVARVRGGGAVDNPLTEDIRALFPREFEVTHRGVSELERRLGIVLGDDETGLIALHVHSALDSGHVEQAMQVAQLTRACIDAVERLTGAEIDVSSMDYNRLMTHVKYMVTRIINDERLSIDVNAMIRSEAPRSYQTAEAVCSEMTHLLGKPVSTLEVGYLAMHIARVAGE